MGYRLENTDQGVGRDLLIISKLFLSFGGIQALTDVSFGVQHREILGIIGPNGAGKTCLLNCINGFYRPQKGEIYFDKKQIARMRPDRIVRLGVIRTFQHDELFRELSTLDNLLMARHIYAKCGMLGAAVYLKWGRRDEIEHRSAVDQVIEFLNLEALRNQIVGVLPYGMQKKVGLARALVMQPKLLLLDEPVAGMTAEEKEEMMRCILEINKLGVTIILIEHDIGVVVNLVDKLMVLDFGQRIAEGPPEDVTNDPRVVQVYLGKDEAVLF
jgi:branched-chain amino acid transport system ATP-binding protein